MQKEQVMIRFSVFVRHWRKFRVQWDSKLAYDSVRREVLYSIPIEFGAPMKLKNKLRGP
jgi:hypothetical protein